MFGYKYKKNIVVNMYDRLFISEQPGTTDKNFVEELKDRFGAIPVVTKNLLNLNLTQLF